MKKISFEIETGIPDINNDIIMPGALKIPNKKIPVLKDFDLSKKGIIGECSAFENNGLIKINAESIEEEYTYDIGFKIIDYEIDPNGSKIVKEAKLSCVGISNKGHAL